jgi:hypothetical protein
MSLSFGSNYMKTEGEITRTGIEGNSDLKEFYNQRTIWGSQKFIPRNIRNGQLLLVLELHNYGNNVHEPTT